MSPSTLRLATLHFALPLIILTASGGAHSSAAAQATAAPPPVVAQPAPAAPPQAYPQQAYPQQAYPQQVYPQQAYPQQAYPQQYPQYQTYPQQYPQTVYVTQPVGPRAPRPRRSLMIAGLSVFLASYAVGVITGAALVDSHCCEDVGWSLLIPVAGPYIAAGIANEGKGVLVLLGTVQVIGVGLSIGGGIQYALTKNAAAKTAQTSALSLKLPRGRDVSFDVSSSPRLMGPTMKLRF